MTQRGAWAFPPQLDRNGRVLTLTMEESVKQSIRIILSTARGERIMRASYGSDVQGYTFEIVNSTMLDLLKTSVSEALLRGEPRLAAVSVKLSTHLLSEGSVLLSIRYRLAGSTEFGEMDHTFPVTS